MSLVTRLVHLVAEFVGDSPEATAPAEASGERLAVATLLVHVARVDGVFAASEKQVLLGLLEGRFGLAEAAAAALLVRAENLDRETDDIATLIEMLGHGIDGEDKRRLLDMAYRLAGADGEVQEFEEALIWRVGHLLGYDDDAIDAVRLAALAVEAGG